MDENEKPIDMKVRPSNAKEPLNFDGYKKCYHCNKYYELGTEHVCFMVQRDKGKSREKHDAKSMWKKGW
jgi:hypothetical protein